MYTATHFLIAVGRKNALKRNYYTICTLYTIFSYDDGKLVNYSREDNPLFIPVLGVCKRESTGALSSSFSRTALATNVVVDADNNRVHLKLPIYYSFPFILLFSNVDFY